MAMKEMKKRLAEAIDIDKIKIGKAGKDKITLDLNDDGEPGAVFTKSWWRSSVF